MIGECGAFENDGCVALPWRGRRAGKGAHACPGVAGEHGAQEQQIAGERSGRWPRPVPLKEMRHDVGALVHLDAGALVDQVREEGAAAPREQLGTVALAPLGARPDLDLEVQHADGLPHPSAKRAALELVEDERARGSRAKGGTLHAHPQLDQGGGPGGGDVECSHAGGVSQGPRPKNDERRPKAALQSPEGDGHLRAISTRPASTPSTT